MAITHIHRAAKKKKKRQKERERAPSKHVKVKQIIHMLYMNT